MLTVTTPDDFVEDEDGSLSDDVLHEDEERQY